MRVSCHVVAKVEYLKWTIETMCNQRFYRTFNAAMYYRIFESLKNLEAHNTFQFPCPKFYISLNVPYTFC